MSAISILHIGVLEDVGPEAGKLMVITDLDDVELLQNTSIESHLFFLELRQNNITKVDTENDLKFLLGFKVALI